MAGDATHDAMRAPFNATDLGNGERYVYRHGERVRHIATTDTWRVWDGVRWDEDRTGEVKRLAVETVCAIYGEAGASTSDTRRRELAAHAMRSEASPRIAAMLDVARSMHPVAVAPEAFDSPATDFLLNVGNGTLDLRTGELRPHRPEDHITKLAPVRFDPDAKSAVWDSFLDRQVPDPEVRDFIQRAAGYSLTGDTGEEVFLFVYGPTAAGKSTFIDAIKAALGDYATVTPFESFLRKRGDAGVRDDLARLAAARVAVALEVDEGRAFDASTLKALTGGDTIACRPLYGRYFEYRPSFKLWLVGNHQPQANAQDSALWRRVRTVPFENTVPEAERDPAIKAAVTRDPDVRAAVLAWAVRGCLLWQRDGLRVPEAVRQATAAYRDACDHVGHFLADCFDPMPGEVTAREMQARYAEWCAANGERPLSAKRLAEALKERGSEPGKSGSKRLWRFTLDALGTPGTSGTSFPVTFTRERYREKVTETGVHGVPRVPQAENGSRPTAETLALNGTEVRASRLPR